MRTIVLSYELIKEGTDILQYKSAHQPKVTERLYVNRIAAYFLFGERVPKILKVTLEAGTDGTDR